MALASCGFARPENSISFLPVTIGRLPDAARCSLVSIASESIRER